MERRFEVRGARCEVVVGGWWLVVGRIVVRPKRYLLKGFYVISADKVIWIPAKLTPE